MNSGCLESISTIGVETSPLIDSHFGPRPRQKSAQNNCPDTQHAAPTPALTSTNSNNGITVEGTYNPGSAGGIAYVTDLIRIPSSRYCAMAATTIPAPSSMEPIDSVLSQMRRTIKAQQHRQGAAIESEIAS
jgi:hypothetical protein